MSQINQSTPKNIDISWDPLQLGFQQKHHQFISRTGEKDQSFQSQESFVQLQLRQQSMLDFDSEFLEENEHEHEEIRTKNKSALKKNTDQQKKISFYPNQQSKIKEAIPQKKKMSIIDDMKIMFAKRKTMAKIGFSNNIWKFHGLRILYYISKFVLILLSSIEKIKLRLVDRKIFIVIDDQSSQYEYFRAKNLLKDKATILDKIIIKFPFLMKIQEKIAAFYKNILQAYFVVFQPDTPIKIIYDLLLIFVISIVILFVPLQFSFNIKFEADDWQIIFFETIPGYILLIEIVVNFNSAFYRRGQIITQRQLIIQNYIKNGFLQYRSILFFLNLGNFIWDVLLTTLLFSKNFLPQYFGLFLILRVYRIQQIFDQLVTVLNLRYRFSKLLSLIKLIYLLLLITHLIACMLHYMADFQVLYLKSDYNWLSKIEIQDYHWFSKYINSLYWAIITTTTVGYGDITPATSFEKGCMVFITIFSSIVFGYMISSIGGIFSQLKEDNEKYLNKMAVINSYLKQRNLSPQLQLKVRIYFEYYLRQSGNEEEMQQMMKIINPELQGEVRIDLYSKYLANVSFIRDGLSEQTLNKLCMVIKERKLQPDEIIFKEDDCVDKLVILISGSLQSFITIKKQKQIQVQNKNKLIPQLEKRIIPLKKISKGAVLYEKNFICSFPAMYSTKAESMSVILEISKNDMIEILKEKPEDFERFNVIKDNVQFNNGYRLVHNYCQICGSSHEMFRCPFTFFQVNKQRLWRNYKKKEEQLRQDFSRSFKTMPSYRICRLDYLDGAIQAGLNNVQIEEDDITAEFLENIGFPMKGLHEEMMGRKVIKEQDEEDEESESEKSKKNDFQNQNGKSKSLYSGQSSLSEQDQIVKLNLQEGDENGKVEPNFELMKKIRKYSILNNPDPAILQAYRGIDARRISRVENKSRKASKTKMDSLKSNNSLKSQPSNQSAEGGPLKKKTGKNFQQIFKRNYEKDKGTNTPNNQSNFLSFGQLAKQQVQLLTQQQQNTDPALIQPIQSLSQQLQINLAQAGPLTPSTSTLNSPYPFYSLVTPNNKMHSSQNLMVPTQQAGSTTIVPPQVQPIYPENMLEILELEYLSTNQHEIFCELDRYQKLLINKIRHEYYDFYFPQFNIDRVLKKLLTELNKRKFQKKMSQIEFQQLRQKTINRFSKLTKSQSIVPLRSSKDKNRLSDS